MKKAFLTGNLTKDIELKTVGEEKHTVGIMTVAVNEIDSSKDATFFNIEVWGKTAEACAKYLSKGSAVSVLADIRANNYEKDDVKYYGYKFVADEVQFVSGTKKEG